MTKIAFPLNYSLMAVYQKYRSPYPLFVTEAAEFDVREIDQEEAPVVASVSTKWRLPIPGIDYSAPRAKTEEYAIRTFNDQFYVPVRKYTKNDLAKWDPITAESFPDLHLKKDFAVTPFEVPVKKGSTYAANPIIGSKTATSFDGGHREYEAHKVRQINNPEVREVALAEAQELIKRFAFINGELWMTTKSEPVIRCDRMHGGQVYIDIVEAGEVERDTATYFRLNRMDECRDFIKAAYPGVEVGTHIKTIKISEPDAFKFDDDADALKAMAEEVHQKLAEYASHPDANPIFLEKIASACEELKQGVENGDETAELISEIANDLGGKFKLNADVMRATVERWNLRPVESAMGMRR
jgi:hypothetical protein